MNNDKFEKFIYNIVISCIMGKDEEILDMLRINARISFSEIARKLSLSEGAIRKRVSNLVKSGTIKKFTIETTGNFSAIVGIKTNPQISTEKLVKKLKAMKVGNVFETTGRFDIVAIIFANNAEEANEILEAIRTSEGVVGTETFSVLR